ncbi:TonB-dependent receptor domain-containing protein [Longitalea luteola]|uniref:TonB-dependent receptor domain-containing protein n=1 Tax=Longitalea luteola TaxID=2812563 RepID=UPI001A97307D
MIADSLNNPIQYATIIISKDTSIITRLISDDKGRYAVTNLPARAYRFTVSYANATDWVSSISLTGDTIINVILKDRYKILGAVAVHGQSEFERKADRYIYTPDKHVAEGNSAIDIMRHVPLVRYDEKSGAFSIIGKEGTTVYINNKKTEIPREMLTEMLRAMPATNIKNVELITNPGSEYAANTSGGVININIKCQLHEGWLGMLSFTTQQGPYNTSVANGYLNYRKGRVGLQFTPVISTNYNYSIVGSTMLFTDSTQHRLYTRNYRRYEVFGNGLKADYDLSKQSALSYNGWFSFVTGQSHPSTTTEFSKAQKDQVDSIQNLSGKGKDNYIYNFGNLNYHHKMDASGKTYLDANLDYNHFFQRRENSWNINEVDAQGKIVSHLGQYTNNLPQNFFNLSARLEYGKTFSKNIKFITGAQLSSTSIDNNQHYYTVSGDQYKLDNTQSLHYQYSERYYAGFVSLAKSLKKWDAKLGLRAEGTNYSTKEVKTAISADSSYINLFPSLSLGYSPNKRNQFGLSYSRKIRRPNVELLFPGRTYYSQDYFSQNNPFLKPVIFNSTEFSYTLLNKYAFSVTYAQSSDQYANFILPIVEDGITKLKQSFYNYGNVKGLNVVLSIRQSLFKNFCDINITPSYNYSKYASKTPEIPVEVTNNSFDLYFNNNIYLSKKKKWTGFITFRYSGPATDISRERLNGISSLTLEVKKVVKAFSFNLIFSDVYNGSSKLNYRLYPNYLLLQNDLNGNVYNSSIACKIRYNFGNNKLRTVESRSSANDDIRNRVN